MFNIIYIRFYYIFLSTIIALSDQYSKYLISKNYKTLLNKDLVIFSLDYIKNYGAAFNLFNGNRIFLSLISFIIAIILLYLILKKINLRNIELFGYSFILGGTLGNGIDRIIKGYVIDYINLKFIDFPIFNIADISINIGLIIIIYSFIKYKKK